jgi:hypothetical protein
MHLSEAVGGPLHAYCSRLCHSLDMPSLCRTIESQETADHDFGIASAHDWKLLYSAVLESPVAGNLKSRLVVC